MRRFSYLCCVASFVGSAMLTIVGCGDANVKTITTAKPTASQPVVDEKNVDGKYEVATLVADQWILKVDSNDPVEMTSRRPHKGRRRVTARLKKEGLVWQPATDVVVHLWTEDRFHMSGSIDKPQLLENGEVDFSFSEDISRMAILVVDRQASLSGFASTNRSDSFAEIEMLPTAEFNGILVDEQGQPLADQLVHFYSMSILPDVVATQKTDVQGQFKLAHLPVNVPMWLRIGEFPATNRTAILGKHFFEPGENRTNQTITLRQTDSSTKSAATVPLLTERIKRRCNSARVSHMQALVILLGDDSEAVRGLANQLTDTSDTPAVYGYLPSIVPATQFKGDADRLKNSGWDLPAAGEVSLVVFDGKEQKVAERKLKAADLEEVIDAAKQGSKFLFSKMLPPRDAQKMLAEAKQVARETGRRIWLIQGGPRCGFCFVLGKWIEQHHEILKKDFVIVKATGSLDKNVRTVMDSYRPDGSAGIPWHVMLDAEGKVLASCEGPLGNIGMPMTFEDKRHFRKMLEATTNNISKDHIDALIESLPKR